MSVRLYRQGTDPITVPQEKVPELLKQGWSHTNQALGFSKARAAAQEAEKRAARETKAAEEAALNAATEAAKKTETELTQESVDRAVNAAEYASDCAAKAREAAMEAVKNLEQITASKSDQSVTDKIEDTPTIEQLKEMSSQLASSADSSEQQ